jgi:hypothetical protein
MESIVLDYFLNPAFILVPYMGYVAGRPEMQVHGAAVLSWGILRKVKAGEFAA